MEKKYTLPVQEVDNDMSNPGIMKNKSIALMLFFVITALINHAYSQNLGWAKQMGGTEYEHGRAIAVDAGGNIYTTGEFRGVADFDPGPGTYNLTAYSACCFNIFVSKLDASGNFLWAKQMGGTDGGGALAIAVDAAGNVYTTGAFNGTADFDPGPGNYNLTSAGSSDIFISKLDAAGNFIWAVQMGGPSDFAANIDQSVSIAVDAAGNVYTTGSFDGTADFDPGPGVYNLSSNYDFNSDAFVSKIDANGNFVWAKQIDGINNEAGRSVAVDAAGNVYTTGIFYSTTDFDPGPGIYNLTPFNGNNYDIYVSKLDADGNFAWAKQMGSPRVSGGSAGTDNSYAIAVDAAGNVYTTGNFLGTADFDPGPGIYNLTAVGDAIDLFVSKLDANGNFVWAKQLGGPSSEQAYAIAVDGGGNVYTTGFFTGTADFDPGPAAYYLSTTGGGADADIFVSKLDAGGNFLWAENMGGISAELAVAIAVDSYGNVYTTGYFGNTTDFDPGPGIYNLTPAGVDDIFVVKLVNNALPVMLLNFTARVNDKKTVDISWTTGTEINNDYFTVERSKNGLGFEQAALVKGAVNSTLPIHYRLIDKTPYSGISYYRLRQTDLDGRYTYSTVVKVQLSMADINELAIYPNPVTNTLQVQVTVSAGESLVWQVRDGTGKVLEQETGRWHTGNQSIAIDVANLPKGMYYLVVREGSRTRAKKFVKQ